LILFGSGVALLSYVLEIFGDHDVRARLRFSDSRPFIVTGLIAGYGLYASRTAYPLLQLALFRIRTFSSAVNGSFFTRLGIGGVPFLLPLLYQVGLGFTPVQSGLPDHAPSDGRPGNEIPAARILAMIGYRMVLISNTVILGLMLDAVAQRVGPGTHGVDHRSASGLLSAPFNPCSSPA